MIRIRALVVSALIAVGFSLPALAQTPTQIFVPNGIPGQTVPADSGHPLAVSATVSASIGAFDPTGNASLAVTTTSSRVALPSSDTSAIVCNTGTTTAFIAFGSSSVVATTGSTPVQGGQCFNFNVGAGVDMAGITATGSTNLTVTTGTGLATIANGSTGGSGAVAALTPIVGGLVSNIVVKNGASSLYSAYVTTGATQGWIMVFNATALPANGATTIGTASGNLQECIYAPASSTTALSYGSSPAEAFSTGIVVGFSSTGCGTLTASTTAAYLSARAQ